MNFSELARIIDQLVKDRGIKREVIVKAIEQSFVVAARKKYGLQGEYEARYNTNDDEIEIYQYKNVVESVRDPIMELSFEQAKALDPDCEIGDQLGVRIENPQFGRVDVQTAKQVLFQKVRDAEREILFKEFKHREGELITGIARRYERGNVIVDLGKADAILSKREMIPGENFRPGDRIQTYLSEVVMTNKGPEIRLSRTSPMFLVKLFEMEVPEIQEGTIEIRSAAREPGQRAKMAVYTRDKEVDPVGACVGMKGARVQNVVTELQGEKIDIVKWSEDLEVFARAALAPAEVTSMIINQEERGLDVIVDESQLSLAIGRRGQNVRLAAMLTGQKINIISKKKLQEKIKRSVENLLQIPALHDAVAQMFVQNGIMSIIDFISSNSHDIAKLSAMDVSTIERMQAEAKALVESEQIKALPEMEEEIVSASAVPMRSGLIEREDGSVEDAAGKFSEAEKRLREELAAFKLK